jgi:hypothetical protein
MKFTYVVGTFFTKFRLFFHSLLHYRHTFSPMHEALYAGRVKFFAAASERFTWARCISGRRRSQYGVLGMHPSGSSKWRKSEGAKLELQVVWGLDSSSRLAELFAFIVLTTLMSAHIAVKWLCHLCSRIPLTWFLRCPRSRWPWLHTNKSAPLHTIYQVSLLYIRVVVGRLENTFDFDLWPWR